MHDRQDSRVCQRTAQGSRTKHTKSMGVAPCRSGQHCNERSVVIELNEKSSLRRYLSLSVMLASRRLFFLDHDDDDTPPEALELSSYTKSGDSSGGVTEPHHNICMDDDDHPKLRKDIYIGERSQVTTLNRRSPSEGPERSLIP